MRSDDLPSSFFCHSRRAYCALCSLRPWTVVIPSGIHNVSGGHRAEQKIDLRTALFII